MYLAVYPLHGLGSIPNRGGLFRAIFSWLITFRQPTLNHQVEPTSPQWHHKPVEIEEEGRSPNHDRQWLR